MSVEEVGEVRYLASDCKDVIYWAIPSYSLLPQKKGIRIWSPPLVHSNDDVIRGYVYYVPLGFLGLCFYSKDSKKPPVKCVRFGIADMKNSDICSCDGEWEEKCNTSGEFRVPKFVEERILNNQFNYLTGTRRFRFRLFCETVNIQRCEVVNYSTQTDNLCASRRVCSSRFQPSDDFVSPRAMKETAHKEKEILTSNYCKKEDWLKSRQIKTSNRSFSKQGVFSSQFQAPEIAQSHRAVKEVANEESKIFSGIANTGHKNTDEFKSRQMKTSRHSLGLLAVADSPTIADVGKEGDDILSRNCSNETDESKKQDLKNLEKLSQNLKELYIRGKNTDLTINVKDREFKAHKTILRARSSVFDAMFSHGLSESKSGVVPIEDCEPDVFEEFLFFIYGGRLNLSSDNACEVYYLADKYDMPELKEECINFLKKTLSTETICDIICLSAKHNERELLNHAINFFARNMEEILVTVKWQLFMKENPTEANELTIKALKLGFTKRKF